LPYQKTAKKRLKTYSFISLSLSYIYIYIQWGGCHIEQWLPIHHYNFWNLFTGSEKESRLTFDKWTIQSVGCLVAFEQTAFFLDNISNFDNICADAFICNKYSFHAEYFKLLSIKLDSMAVMLYIWLYAWTVIYFTKSNFVHTHSELNIQKEQWLLRI